MCKGAKVMRGHGGEGTQGREEGTCTHTVHMIPDKDYDLAACVCSQCMFICACGCLCLCLLPGDERRHWRQMNTNRRTGERASGSLEYC